MSVGVEECTRQGDHSSLVVTRAQVLPLSAEVVAATAASAEEVLQHYSAKGWPEVFDHLHVLQEASADCPS